METHLEMSSVWHTKHLKVHSKELHTAKCFRFQKITYNFVICQVIHRRHSSDVVIFVK